MNWIDINVPKSRVCCLYFYATFLQQFYTTVFRIYSKISYCVKRPVIRTYWNIDKYYNYFFKVWTWYLISIVVFSPLFFSLHLELIAVIVILSYFRLFLCQGILILSMTRVQVRTFHIICFSTKFNFSLKHIIKPY